MLIFIFSTFSCLFEEVHIFCTFVHRLHIIKMNKSLNKWLLPNYFWRNVIDHWHSSMHTNGICTAAIQRRCLALVSRQPSCILLLTPVPPPPLGGERRKDRVTETNQNGHFQRVVVVNRNTLKASRESPDLWSVRQIRPKNIFTAKEHTDFVRYNFLPSTSGRKNNTCRHYACYQNTRNIHHRHSMMCSLPTRLPTRSEQQVAWSARARRLACWLVPVTYCVKKQT